MEYQRDRKILPMNREQRRNLEKKIVSLKKSTMSKRDFWNSVRDKPYLKKDATVKLNYDQIVSYSYWENGNKFYKKFVEENKDTVFHLVTLPNLQKDPVLFGLRFPDGTVSDFNFHENDLIEIKEDS